MTNEMVGPDGALRGPFIDNAYQDAMALVMEAAQYLEGPGMNERDQLETNVRGAFAAESMRLTTRLMQTVSWFMVQRAVQNGELTKEQAREPARRLGAIDVCMGEETQGAGQLPEKMLELMIRSRALFEQVLRMEAMLLGADDAFSSPVHHLLEKLQK